MGTVREPMDRRIEEAWLCLERGEASLERLKHIARQIRGDPGLPHQERTRQLNRLDVVIWEYSTREYDGY